MNDWHSLVEELQPRVLETLSSWIRIPSVRSEAECGAPFGKEVRRALDAALKDAESLGFTVRNFDGYCGDARIGPLGVNPLAILVHLDVVPVGTGWEKDPFGAEIADERMYGRGTADDKGPAVAALYAVYAYQQAGLPLNREIRIIFGCDEESDWECMKHYAKVCDIPKSGFSPDGSFPLINTEKGTMHVELRGKADDGIGILSIQVGERWNVIPGEASALLEGLTYLDQVPQAAARFGFKVTAREIDGNTELFSEGIPGHAAYPEGRRNALGQLLMVLRELGAGGAIAKIADYIGIDYTGSRLGIACSDEISGALTCNMGIMRYDRENGLYATLDLRCPMLADRDLMYDCIGKALAPQVQAVMIGQKKAHHVPAHSKLVRDLLTAYHEETGLPAEAESTGGGTYARVLEEGVAFGCCFPGCDDLCHQSNEYIMLKDLEISMDIFVHALILLNQ